MAPLFSLTTELIVGSAPPERAGAASAISETGAEVGGAVGIAILGSVGTAVYRGAVAAGLPPAIPPQIAEIAGNTLGGAVGAARQLPHELAQALLHVTREAFALGLHVAAGISALVAIAAALLPVALLRRLPAGASSQGWPESERSARAAG